MKNAFFGAASYSTSMSQFEYNSIENLRCVVRVCGQESPRGAHYRMDAFHVTEHYPCQLFSRRILPASALPIIQLRSYFFFESLQWSLNLSDYRNRLAPYSNSVCDGTKRVILVEWSQIFFQQGWLLYQEITTPRWSWECVALCVKVRTTLGEEDLPEIALWVNIESFSSKICLGVGLLTPMQTSLSRVLPYDPSLIAEFWKSLHQLTLIKIIYCFPKLHWSFMNDPPLF